MQLEMGSSGSEVTDFSSFRMPLLLFSFGVIIFVTMRNKKREGSEPNQILEQSVMQRIMRLRGEEGLDLVAE